MVTTVERYDTVFICRDGTTWVFDGTLNEIGNFTQPPSPLPLHLTHSEDSSLILSVSYQMNWEKGRRYYWFVTKYIFDDVIGSRVLLLLYLLSVSVGSYLCNVRTFYLEMTKNNIREPWSPSKQFYHLRTSRTDYFTYGTGGKGLTRPSGTHVMWWKRGLEKYGFLRRVSLVKRRKEVQTTDGRNRLFLQCCRRDRAGRSNRRCLWLTVKENDCFLFWH